MVDFKEVQNAAALKANEVSKEDIEILDHQNVHESVSIGQKGVAQLDIKYQMDKTFVFPIPSGRIMSLNGYVKPETVREWYLSQFNEKRETVKDQDVKS